MTQAHSTRGAASWVVAVRQMNGMDMGGLRQQPGSFASFVALCAPIMAAMMPPGAIPAALRRAHAGSRVRAVLLVGCTSPYGRSSAPRCMRCGSRRSP